MGGGGHPREPVIMSSSDHRPLAPRAMTVVRRPQQPQRCEKGPPPPARPKFNHQYTSDRLREGLQTPPPFSMASNIRRDRKSIFKELGLDADDPADVSRAGTPIEGDQVVPELTITTAPTTNHPTEESVLQSRDEAATGDKPTPTPKDARFSPRSSIASHGDEDGSSSSSSATRPWYAKLTPGRRPKVKTVASAHLLPSLPPPRHPGSGRPV